MIYIFLVINIIFLAFGQILWKFGMQKVHEFNILNIIVNPYIIGGVILYAFATLLWLYILSKEELSFVYPLQSITYILGTILATIIFKENVSIFRWVGIVTLVIGATLVATSN